MAGEVSSNAKEITGSFIQFYMDANTNVRVRVYLSPQAADFECIMTHAHFDSMVAALSGADTNWNTTEKLGPMGADYTVHS